MARKPKIEFEVKCESCGCEPEQDKNKSTENWTVFSTTCPKCGGRVKMSIKE
jgi:Zn finger protein HypA/HybF involved in hydrogenase expression